MQGIQIELGAALAEAAETQRKMADALGRLARTRDEDVRIDKTVLYRYRPAGRAAGAS